MGADNSLPDDVVTLKAMLRAERADDGASLSYESKDALWARFFMGATTTEAIRRAIQHSQEETLAGRYGINQKTVSKRSSEPIFLLAPRRQ